MYKLDKQTITQTDLIDVIHQTHRQYLIDAQIRYQNLLNDTVELQRIVDKFNAGQETGFLLHDFVWIK